jgi:hypothetical protein
MAKSNKQAQPTKPKPAEPKKAAVRPIRDFLQRDTQPDEAAPDFLKKGFYALAGLALVVLLWLSLGSGINADDKFQNDYSTKLVNYYGTMGADTSALFVKDGNMHLYGGFFEVVSGFTNKAFGWEPNQLAYHHVRHLWSAFFGWLAMLCAALLARHLAGWRAGLITLIIMLLSPRFVGDSLMNPKDIPFAAGYIMALYNMVRVLDAMPRPNRWHLAGLATGLAIGLATRAGGLLSFAYLGMFAGLHFMLRNGMFRAFGNTRTLGRYALIVGGTAAAGYLLAVLFWPFALQSPLGNPLAALSKFADLEVRIRVLYDGLNQKSDVTPWHYPLKWILNTIPLGALPGLVLCAVGSLLTVPFLLLCIFMPNRLSYKWFWYFAVAFSGFFPVLYVIYKNSVIHDGWRHLTFVYPAVALMAGLFWHELMAFFSSKKAVSYAVAGVLALSLADAGWFIATNPTMPYVYFNPLVGGTQGAYGQFETDYWGVSIRDGLTWMEEQGILNDTMSEQIVIATNMAYSTQKLTHKYGDKVRIKYLKWDKRHDDAWDYALFPTRFIEGPTLTTGKWPPDNAVHIVRAGGAPILAILRDSTKNAPLGLAANKISDFDTAISRLSAEVAQVTDNDLAWNGLAQAYISKAQVLATTNRVAADSCLELARAAAEKALTITPSAAEANNLIAMYWIEKNDMAKAKAQFELSAKREPDNGAAFYYLALIAYSEQNQQLAMDYLKKTLAVAPMYRPAYELALRIYEESGDTQQAQRIRGMLQRLK